MKKLILAAVAASLVSVTVYAAPVWSAPQTIIKVGENPVAGTFVVGQNPNTKAVVKCFIRAVNADSAKLISAIALTQKAAAGNATLFLEFKTDPLGVLPGSPCILSGIQAE